MPGNVSSGPVVILLGSNQGNRLDFLAHARHEMGVTAGSIHAVSSIYESSSWGDQAQPDYLNQAVILNTRLEPPALLDVLLDIEKSMGRKRTAKWASRIIDLDILFYGDRIVRENNLQIPHPRISDRRFTLMPLAELLPGFIHPVSGKSMIDLLLMCSDNLRVKLTAAKAYPGQIQ